MVLTDGCFDPVHYGHIAYLRAARTFGRPLVVRIAPDDVIFEKGRVPFQDHAERMLTVLALDMVDEVCASQSLAETVRDKKPSHLVKGIDWQGKLPDDVLAACQDCGTQLVFVRTQGKTSSERLKG